MIAVAMGVLISGLVALALTQQLQPLFQTTVNDAGAITEAEMRAEYLTNGYLSESARFSFYQAGYAVGNYSIDAESAQKKFGSNNGGWGGSNGIESFYDDLFNEMEDSGDTEFSGYVNSLESASPRCTIKTAESGYDFGIAKESPYIKVESATSGESIIEHVACARRGIETNYSINKDELNVSTDATHIHNMAWATQLAFGEMWNESESMDGSGANTGEATVSTPVTVGGQRCYDPTSGGVPNSVKNQLKDEAEREAYSQAETVAEQIAISGKDGLLEVSNEVGIPIIDTVIDFAAPGFDREPASGPHNGILIHDNDTSVSKDNSNTGTEACDGDDSNCVDWECTDSDWNYDSGSDDCEPAGGYPSQSCDEGDIDSGDNVCEDTSVSESDCNSRSDWTWDVSESRCVYDDDQPCDSYDGKDLDTDGAGGCELAAGESTPSPTCNTWKQEYEATYDYEVNKVELNTSIYDDAAVPTNLSGNTNIPLKRRFVYDFS